MSYISRKKKYRLFFNNDPSPIFVFDELTFEIMDVNDRALTEYGAGKVDLVGRSFLELTDTGEWDRIKKFIQSGKTFIYKVLQVRTDGTKFYVNLRASHGEYFERKAIIASTIDITEHLQAEQQLIQASKMATLGEMSAGIAHELNQPLSIIGLAGKYFVKTIDRKEGIDFSKFKEVAEDIMAQVERAADIINHLRDFGRKSEVEREKVDLREPIEGVFQLLGQQLKVHGISFEIDISENLPPIWGTVNRIEQVFINLIINARDAIEQRGEVDDQPPPGLINVKVFVSDGRVLAMVSDNGCGIMEKDRERIFEPFFTTKEVGKGTGLGLSISYGIVHDYNGYIHVESTIGQGTTFRLSFPAIKEEDQ